MIGENENGELTISLEAYRDLQRDYIKAQNKLQDIGFVIAEATSPCPADSAGDYIREILGIWERD